MDKDYIPFLICAIIIVAIIIIVSAVKAISKREEEKAQEAAFLKEIWKEEEEKRKIAKKEQEFSELISKFENNPITSSLAESFAEEMESLFKEFDRGIQRRTIEEEFAISWEPKKYEDRDEYYVDSYKYGKCLHSWSKPFAFGKEFYFSKINHLPIVGKDAARAFALCVLKKALNIFKQKCPKDLSGSDYEITLDYSESEPSGEGEHCYIIRYKALNNNFVAPTGW